MAYTRVNWEDGSTSHNTPISAENLNKMDAGIKELDTNKANKSGGDFTGDISVNLSGDASKPFVKTDYANGEIHINSKQGAYTNYKIGKVERTVSGNTYEYNYPDKSGTFVITDANNNTDLNGLNTIESGVKRSVVEGYTHTLTGNWTDACHVEGYRNTVSGGQVHAEGSNNSVSEDDSHVEGKQNTVSAKMAHAEGYNNTVSALYGHAEGGANTVSGEAAHAEGTNNTASGERSHAEGANTEATAESSHAEGVVTDAYGIASHAEGGNRNADGSGISEERTVTIGSETVSVLGPKAVGVCAHAEGVRTLAYGYTSHASGIDTDATGEGSYTEGYQTKASGKASHAEGNATKANGFASHAEGSGTTASGSYSHAEGSGTIASGKQSHAEGSETVAKWQFAHAEGLGTTAGGFSSHAQNNHTIAGYNSQTAMGKFNNNKPTNLLEVGNGADDNNRSNAMEVTADGDLLIKNGGVSLYGLDENKEVLGAKNLLPMKNFTTTQSGVTIVCDSSGATLNGTATGTYGFIVTNDFTLPAGDYILSGCPGGGGYPSYQIEISKKPSGGSFAQLGLDSGNGFSFSASATDTFRVAVYVYSQYGEYSNFKYYPMIRLATDLNPTYRPYAMSNQELTSNVNTLNNNKELLGVKNLLPLTLENLKALNTAGSWSGNAYTLNGVTFTANTDSLGSVTGITVNGTSTATTIFRFTPRFGNFMSNTKYYISGAPTNTNAAYYQIYDLNTSSGISNILTEDYELTYTNERTMQGLVLRVNSGVSITNQVIYPMIRLATDPNPTYRPYAMSNQELTQRLLALEARLS